MYDAALQMRLLRAQRKALGACIYCGGSVLVTSTMCLVCADKKRPGTEPLIMRNKRRYPIQRRSAVR